MNKISELEAGSVANLLVMVKSVTPGTTAGDRPSEYLDLIVRDLEGSEIFSKLWNVTKEQKEVIQPLTLVNIQGKVTTYKGNLQVVVSTVERGYSVDGLTIEDFVKKAPLDAEVLLEAIHTAASEITDYLLRNIVNFSLNKMGKELLTAPAAKSNHHNYYAGLAYHKFRMLQIADFVCKQRPGLDRNLVYAGIILHDIAKPAEMDHTLGIVRDYTFVGKMVGHIALSYGWTIEAAIHYGYDLSDQRLIMLQHMLLSHHNLGEWGSPVQPQINEAVALHYIDQLDAKLQMTEDALETVTTDEGWTKRIFALENKELFKHLPTFKS